MNSKFVKKLAACIVASCLMATVAVPTVANAAGANYSVAQTSIVDTTTNYRENPIGIDMDSLRFGWRMESNLIGQQQAAYEVNLYQADDSSKAIWTTGKVEDGVSTGIVYDGEPLAAATGYHWVVTVWDKDGKSYSSNPAYFETGVTNEQDWNAAEFIQLPVSSAAPIFRTEQDVDGKINSARLYITAIGVYEAYINGEQVGKINGDGTTTYHHMNPGYGNGTTTIGYETYDVTSYLNDDAPFALSILAGTGWNDGKGDGAMGSTSGQPAVKALMVIDYTDQDGNPQQKKVTTNTEDWRGTLDGPITVNGVFYGEDYDARKQVALGDYKNVGYDDSNWLSSGSKEQTDSHILTNTFDPVTTKYLRLSVSETGPATSNDKENRLQIMELEALDTTGNNVVKGKIATVNSNQEVGDQWNVANMTDGDDGTKTDYGYTSAILGTEGLESFYSDPPLTVDFAFDQPTELASLKLYCRTGIASVTNGVCPNYAKVYSIQVSDDGQSWKDVVTNYDAGRVENSFLQTTGITTTEYPGQIIASRGDSGQIVDAFEHQPVSATLYTGEAAESQYEGGEIAVDNYYAHQPSEDELYQNGFVQVPEGQPIFENGITLKKGQTMIVNIGQNMTAIPEISFQSVPGATVTMKFAEMLNDGSSVGNGAFQANGPKGSLYTKSLRSARSEAHYTFATNEMETYQTKTSFFGYQYVQITATEDVTIYSMRSRALSSVSEQTGYITTNNEDVNRLFLNALYGQLSNYFTIPTDCPQRDERKGWTGDAQVFAQTGIYNFDAASFMFGYQDMLSELTMKQGYPGAVTSQWEGFNHWASGWSDIQVIYPWVLYQQTGDISVLETNWEAMNHYMDWLKNNERAAYQAPSIQRNGFGDWLAFQGTGYEVIADYYYGYVTQLMEQMAGILEDAEKQNYYSERFENLKQTFLNTHVSFNEEPQLEPTIFEQPTTDHPGSSNIITNTFDETTAKYVRFTVSRTGPGTSDDNEYRLQMMELNVSKDGGENYALGKSVEASNTFDWGTSWGNAYLTDGNTETGYSSANNGGNTLSGNPITVTVDLGQEQTFNQIDITCRNYDKSMEAGVCVNYPKDYTIEVSSNGTDWTTIGRFATDNKPADKLVIKSGTGSPVMQNKGGKYEDNSQTALLWMLKLGYYTSDEMKDEAIRLLVKNIKNEDPDPSSIRAQYGENTLSVGFLGSNVITPVLTDIGYSDVSYDLLLNDSMPSWLFEVKAGATTIWERWNSYDPENGFGDQEMNSFNHFSYGSVVEWMYQYMVGIDSDLENPGFKHIILQPTLDTGEKYNDQNRIDTVNGSYDSYYGLIESNWTSNQNKLSTYHTVIPANTTSTLYLPVSADMMEGFTAIPGITFVGMTEHNGIETAQFELASGGYDFTVQDGKVIASIADGYVTEDVTPSNTDKSVLQTVISYAENAKETDEYFNAIPSVKDSFEKALTEAKAVNENTSATQEQVDAAWKTLLNEIHKLGFQAGDKTKLQALYDEMSKVDLSQYKDGTSKDNFVTALEQAAKVLADQDAMQKEIDKAAEDLETAYSLLEKAADKSQLEALIEATKNYEQKEYTENSWVMYAEAKAKAEEIYNDPEATQEEINEAVDNLLRGMLELRYRADKTLLKEAVEAAEGIEISEYTAESAASFEALLAEAKAMLRDNNLSKEDEAEINAKAMELKAAQSKLERVENKGSGTEEGVQTGQESTTTKTNSAKTGDVTPIAGAVALAVAGVAVVALKKRK